MTDLRSANRVEEMKIRLARVGATEEEINDFAEQWVNDPEWDADDKERLWALGDPLLRQELEATRLENLHAVTPDEELEELDEIAAAADEEERRIAELDAAAAEAAKGKVAEVMAWVYGDDAAGTEDEMVERAQASLDHEVACAEPRKTLIAKLREVIEAATGSE